MSGAVAVSRARWLGYRWARHGLGESLPRGALNDLLMLGFQDSRQSGAIRSLALRTSTVGRASVRNAITADGPLVMLWGARIAPHAYPVAQLDLIRDGLAALEGKDGPDSSDVAKVAKAMTAVVREPMPKGEVSTQVAAGVPAALITWCEPCGAHHVPDGLFRVSGRHAQLVLTPAGKRGTLLCPAPAHRQERVDDPAAELLAVFLRVNGPTSKTAFRDWCGGSASAATALWKQQTDKLVRVRIDDRPCDVPEPLLDELTSAPDAHGAVLLPPNDPYARQVDRTLLVPDKKQRQEVWRPIGSPGVLAVDGEVAGSWRYRSTEQTLAVEPFGRLTAAQRKQSVTGAERIADFLGATDLRVTSA